MNTRQYQFIAFGVLLSVAGVVGAYTPATTGAFGANTDAPLNVSGTNQDKAGGLSVSTFQARGNAYFSQQTFVQGGISGGNVQKNGTTTVVFGDSNHTVNTSVNGGIEVGGVVQSNSLATGPKGGKKPVCANEKGTLFLCNTAPVAGIETGSVSFRIDGMNQAGNFVSIKSNTGSAAYTITAPSSPITVETGSYVITQTDMACLPSMTPVQLSGNATDFVITKGSSHTITFNC